jgi:crotonobetainyl-CoA:carnitine CoA-transferase CaiB-like acyl-CoA transferase
MMLADLGADVIKVESLPHGDPSRRFLPPAIGNESAAFMMMNRNKRGVAIDLRPDAGRAVLRTLLASADVLIENFRAGTMDRMGLGYDAIRAENPTIVWCEISGFGRTGPLADRGGFDLTAQGYSGLMSGTGEGPDRPPVKVGVPITDITAGILGALGIVTAYVQRLKTGEGQRVDTSLFEAGITHTYWHAAIALATGASPGPLGTAHPLSAPYESFETSDGWLNLGASNQTTWERLPAALGLPDLADDERFRDNAGRMQHRQALAAILQNRFKERSTAEWLETLDEAQVPAGPLLDLAAVLEHPQTLARQMVVTVPHRDLGEVKTVGAPIKFSSSSTEPVCGAPLLGEHTHEILQTVGYSATEIAELENAGVILTI